MLIAAHELTADQVKANPDHEQIYCGFDNCLTHEIDGVLDKHPQANDSLIYQFELGMQAPAIQMGLRGFRVDPVARERAIYHTSEKLKAATNVMNALTQAVCDRNFNPNSGAQLKDLFYRVMGYAEIGQNVKGKWKASMDRKVLERLQAHFYARPIISAVLLIRDLNKTLSVLETEIDDDWRWRCSYNIGGTKTGRWSSSKSPIGTGNNFQNITDELRRIFIPDDGYKLCGIDYEQSESRDVGHLCGILFNDWSYLDACESGDLHTQVCKLVWRDLPWTGDPAKDKAIANRKFYRHFTYRDAAKRLGHGSNYYGKPPQLSLQIHIPLHLVKQFQDAYFAAFPCIPRMHAWVSRTIQSEMNLVTTFGRRRDFFDRTDAEETLRGAIAYLFQSATGDRLNLALWRLWKKMGTRIQLLAQLHDAVYFQYPIAANENEIIAEARSLMRVEQTCGANRPDRKFVVPTDVVVGFNWAHRFKLDEEGNRIDWNPRGLDSYKIAA